MIGETRPPETMPKSRPLTPRRLHTHRPNPQLMTRYCTHFPLPRNSSRYQVQVLSEPARKCRCRGAILFKLMRLPRCAASSKTTGGLPLEIDPRRRVAGHSPSPHRPRSAEPVNRGFTKLSATVVEVRYQTMTEMTIAGDRWAGSREQMV